MPTQTIILAIITAITVAIGLLSGTRTISPVTDKNKSRSGAITVFLICVIILIIVCVIAVFKPFN